MTSGLFASPRRPGRRRALVVLIVAAGVAAAVHLHHRAPTPAPDADVAKPQQAAPEQLAVSLPAVAPPARPDPIDWAGAARCRAQPDFARAHATLDQVRHWVEVDHLRAWKEAGAWWLPLSGEGSPQFPSGFYMIVPPDGGPCGAAIVN